MNTLNKHDITAVILSGGKGRRMDGKDKGLVELGGRPLIEYVIDAIEPQVEAIIINANRNLDTYSAYGYPVISDTLADYQGPLAGFFSALKVTKTSHIVTLPCDGPLLPDNLVDRLISALQQNDADIAVAHDGDRMQPVYSLIPRRLTASLNAFLDEGGRKIDLWYKNHRVALADFSDCPETFRNINTDEQRELLQKEGLFS
ncbi:MAG: molybdenum cofactor guanylyltransferase [Gammaproteobacteria bacterium]|nr:molybdenum cofactor guanylyltransferase [Gammaproteobacteria bacterium]